jgi:hypothetical protein
MSIPTLAQYLSDRHGVEVSHHTIKSRLQAWEVKMQNRMASSDTALQACIKVLLLGWNREE